MAEMETEIRERTTPDLTGYKCPVCSKPWKPHDNSWSYGSFLVHHKCNKEYECTVQLSDCILNRHEQSC